MRIKAGNKLSNDAAVIDLGSGADLTENDGHVTVSGLGGGSVSSVFSRTGAVTAADADYAGVFATRPTGTTAASRFAGGRTASGAPTTGTWAVGDLVPDALGRLYECVQAGTPGLWATATPNVFYPEAYGAVGDGATDDTAAIQSAIDAAITAGGGVVQFQLKTYLLSSAPRTDRSGNAILALPTGYTGNKASITLLGATSGENAGTSSTTVLKTARTDTYDVTNGQPSMFGGPTSGSNQQIQVAIYDIYFQTPTDPRISAIDLGLISTFRIDGVSISNNAGAPAGTTNPRQFGLRCCPSSNYAMCYIGTLGVYGAYNGLILASTEHISIVNYICQWATVGLSIGAGAPGHTGVIQQYQSQSVKYHIAGLSNGSGVQAIAQAAASPYVPQHIYITQWDIEDRPDVATIAHLYDTNSNLAGHVNFLRFQTGASPAIQPGLTNSGGGRLHYFDLTLTCGPQTVPAVPASTVAFPIIYRDSVYYFSGGTVSAITIGATTLGVTSGPVFVPSGQSLAVTYTGVPTLNALLVL